MWNRRRVGKKKKRTEAFERSFWESERGIPRRRVGASSSAADESRKTHTRSLILHRGLPRNYVSRGQMTPFQRLASAYALPHQFRRVIIYGERLLTIGSEEISFHLFIVRKNRGNPVFLTSDFSKSEFYVKSSSYHLLRRPDPICGISYINLALRYSNSRNYKISLKCLKHSTTKHQYFSVFS